MTCGCTFVYTGAAVITVKHILTSFSSEDPGREEKRRAAMKNKEQVFFFFSAPAGWLVQPLCNDEGVTCSNFPVVQSSRDSWVL